MIWRGDGTNRVCKSLLVLFDQVDAHYPGRATGNDGTIGDTSHQARKSDHNPDEHGIVRALDITHDPAHGFDSYKFADFLREHWDDRVKYLISNRRIANADIADRTWRAYDGEDAHDHHIHISARPDDRADDDRQWDIGAFLGTGGTSVAPKDGHALIKIGDHGPAVAELQKVLGGLDADGYFGHATDAAVRNFQFAHDLMQDGEVGPKTWAILLGAPTTPQQPANVMTSKGSWYSQYNGKYHWHDSGDAPGSAALGVPDDAQGIARPGHDTLGTWFMVRAPNGKVSIEIQSDLGPAAFTGRTIDISAAAAERFGYSPQNFPTDSIFTFWPVDPPKEVAGLSKQLQATKYRDIRKDIHMTDPIDQQPQPSPQPQPAPATTLPALPGLPSMPPEMQRVINLVLGNRDQSHSFIDTIAKFHNAMWPDKQVVAGPQVAPVVLPAPTTAPIHKTPAFQIGAIGGVLTGILHQFGVIDPNMAILGAIVSAGTAFLGPSGVIVGTVVMNVIRAFAAESAK